MNVEELFLDTNLLVYARDRSEPEKGALAQNLLQRIFAAGMPHISTQVLSEFFWTVTRKLALPTILTRVRFSSPEGERRGKGWDPPLIG